jgi:RNA polymerase sigma-70 factor, ECF subfamily
MVVFLSQWIIMHMCDKKVAKIQTHRPHGGDQAALLEALKNGNLSAYVELYDSYAGYVRSMLVRIRGADDDLPDLINEVFCQVLKSVHSIRRSDRIKEWVAKTTVYVARGAIRRRKRRNWLIFFPSAELYENAYGAEIDYDKIEIANAIRQIVNSMRTDDQLIFTLRFFEEMEISELANAVGVSPATVKRRLVKCENRFKKLAQGHPLLENLLDNSPKWRRR